MAQKKPIRYQMDFEGTEHFSAAVLMGVAFFLRTAYYFGFTRPESVGVGNLLLFLILPMMLEAAFMILLRAVRLNAPGIFGILGALYCVLLLLQSFQYGNLIRTILAIIAYLICVGLLLAASGGMLSKGMAVTVTFATAVVRLVFFDFGKYITGLHLISFLPEAAALCGLLALGLFAKGLKEPKRK